MRYWITSEHSHELGIDLLKKKATATAERYDAANVTYIVYSSNTTTLF